MFKQNFTNICAKKNVAPSVVCRSIGLTPSTYSQWRDDSVPRKTTLIKIANYLGVTVEDLLREEDEEKKPAVDPLRQRVTELWEQLDEAGQEEAMRYLEYLRSRRK